MSGAHPLQDPPHPRESVHLFGQEAAEREFLDVLRSGRPPHGWLITGPRGVGKATLAWRIARAMISGEDVDTLEFGIDHPSFRKIAALSEPGVHYCRPGSDPRSGRARATIGVDDVRSVNGFLQLSAAEGGWRVVIVDAADDMTVAAANALLKILEEPPSRTMLLLIAHAPSALLPTLRSRCRTLRCGALAPRHIARALEALGASADAAAAVISLAGGSVGEAHRILQGRGLETYAEIVSLMAGMPRMDQARASKLAEAASEPGSDMFRRLIGLAVSRVAVSAAGKPIAAVSDAEAANFSRLAGDSRSAANWAECATEIDERLAAGRAVNLDPQLLIFDTLLRIDRAASRAVA